MLEIVLKIKHFFGSEFSLFEVLQMVYDVLERLFKTSSLFLYDNVTKHSPINFNAIIHFNMFATQTSY